MLTFDYAIGKEDILSKVSESQIVAYYTETDDLRKPIISPFRQERTPSFTFKQIGEKILWRDWGSGNYGDAFSFVQKWYSCSFYEALKHINDDLILNIEHKKSIVKMSLMRPEKASIKTQRQMLVMTDYKYWSQFGISLRTLGLFDVYSARYVWINDKLRYTYRNHCPIYEYFISDDIKQIYCPYAEKHKDKFRYNGNNSTLLGYNMLPLFGDKLILSKSLKDIMTLYELGFSATSFVGETTHNDTIIKQLKKRFNEIVLLYDNDKVGIEQSRKLHTKYGFRQLFTKAKNISDEMQTNREVAYNFILDV